MIRREPPPIASWALEHLTTGDQDEALAGDLLEHYRAGRSDAWFWRQVIASCVLSWWQSLTARGPALVFALAWSLLAPAWKAALDRIADPLSFERAWQTVGLLWLPIGLIGWTALHAAFLWIGLLVYQLAHTITGLPLARKDLRRAFWIATLALPPISGLVFVFAGIYYFSWPGLAHATLAHTALGQIADLGILPDLIRVPYFAAFLFALCAIAPLQRRSQREPQPGTSSSGAQSSVFSGTIALAAAPRQTSPARFIAFMAGVGLMNALIAAVIVCRLPDQTSPSLASVLIRAACYVALALAGGVIGAYIYWQSPWAVNHRQPPIPFSLVALVCASGWVWIPSMILFGDSLSAGAAIVATIATYALISGLRRASYFMPAPGHSITAPSETRLFEESLYRPPADLAGYAIALSLYAAGASLAAGSNYGAACLLTVGAALFAWRRTIPRDRLHESRLQYRSAAIRVATAVIPAILVTAWALLDGVSHRNRAAAAAGLNNNPSLSTFKNGVQRPKIVTATYRVGGYESVILWPLPQKKQIVPPVSSSLALFGPDNKRPFIIRFDGPYTYVQPPDKQPGPNAHQVHGTPLDANIHSSNALPVVMQAHQNLLTSVPVAQCRQIDVQIENRDNLAGRVSLALLLTNDNSVHGRTIYVGQQPIASTDPQHFTLKTEPAVETLHFVVPVSSPGQKFTGITVMLLPDVEHKFIAPRIALEQFEILPR